MIEVCGRKICMWDTQVCMRVSLDSSLSSMDTNSDTESRHKYGKMITDSHAFAW